MGEFPCGFDAQRARSKRAFPMFVDALLRDSMDLGPKEFGAYHFILYALWTRHDLVLPNDPHVLGQICKCSKTVFINQYAPALRRFFRVTDGMVWKKKLVEVARDQEEYIFNQHAKRCEICKKSGQKFRVFGLKIEEYSGEISELCGPKPLKTNKPQLTGDVTHKEPEAGSGNNLTKSTRYIGSGDHARAREEIQTDREILLEAMGADPVSGLIGPSGKMIGRLADMQEFGRWKSDLHLDPHEIVDVVREVMENKRDGPPSTFTYFTPAMKRYAGSKQKPALKPDEEPHDQSPSTSKRSQSHRPGSTENLASGFSGALSKIQGRGRTDG